MADLDINITVNGNGGGSPAAEEAGLDTQTAKGNARVAFTVEEAMRVAQRLSKQVATNVVGSIGTFSGNNVLQANVERFVGFTGRTASVALAFVANPILGTFALGGEAIDIGFQAAKAARQRQWQNAQAAQLRRSAGYLSNDNRGNTR